MKNNLNVSKGDNCETHINDDGMAVPEMPVLKSNGTLLMPGADFKQSLLTNGDRLFATIDISIHGHGLYFTMTADGARSVARTLIACAEEIEQHALTLAQAAMPEIFKPKDPKHD